jgi:hypothetical protein
MPLAKQVTHMNPPAQCDSDTSDAGGQHFSELRGVGWLDPTESNRAALAAGRVPSRYPDGLVIQVARYTQPSKWMLEPWIALSKLDKSAERLQIPSSTIVDGYAINLAAGSFSDTAEPLKLICVSGVNQTTESSGAIVCRSIDPSIESVTIQAMQAKAEQIVHDDFPSIRF